MACYSEQSPAVIFINAYLTAVNSRRYQREIKNTSNSPAESSLPSRTVLRLASELIPQRFKYASNVESSPKVGNWRCVQCISRPLGYIEVFSFFADRVSLDAFLVRKGAAFHNHGTRSLRRCRLLRFQVHNQFGCASSWHFLIATR